MSDAELLDWVRTITGAAELEIAIVFEYGGDIPGHQFHEHGLEIDVRPMRTDRKQCRWGGSYRLASYDRAATRDLIRAIRAAAPGHVKLIFFNDPVLIKEGLTRWYTGHDDHQAAPSLGSAPPPLTSMW